MLGWRGWARGGTQKAIEISAEEEKVLRAYPERKEGVGRHQQRCAMRCGFVLSESS